MVAEARGAAAPHDVPADPYERGLEKQLAFDLRRFDQVANQGLGVIGLCESPGDEFFRCDDRLSDFESVGVGRDLVREALGREPPAIDQGDCQRPQTRVEYALIAESGQKEGFAQSGRQLGMRLFFDNENTLAGPSDPCRGHQCGDSTA
jgi:hypothetical protein